MTVEPAADSEEDLAQNGPKAVLITATSPEDRMALAVLIERFRSAQPPEVESDSTH